MLQVLMSDFGYPQSAYSFISGYSASDVTLIEFDGNSLAIWGINPRSQEKLAADLDLDIYSSSLMMTMDIKFTRFVWVNTISCLLILFQSIYLIELKVV